MTKKLTCLIFLLMVLGSTGSVWALPGATPAELATSMPETF